MTQDEIVKYTDHLLAEFYKNCQKQYNKENRQTDIILSNGDFSTLQNMMCEAITNIQRQSVEKACDWLVMNASDYAISTTGDDDDCVVSLDMVEDFRKAMEE
jgi:hypothetical protein